MISGMYLGEIARLVIADCACSKLLFGGKLSAELKTPGRFYTKYISEIEKCVPVFLFTILLLLLLLLLVFIDNNRHTAVKQ